MNANPKVGLSAPARNEWSKQSTEAWALEPNGKTEATVYGVGVGDLGPVKRMADGKLLAHPAYRTWTGVLERAYCPKLVEKQPTYADVSVCPEWLTFSSFYDWWSEHYIEGFQLDKDLLIPGNRQYRPEACSFVPHELNSLTTDSGATRGDLPMGVGRNRAGYRAHLGKRGKRWWSPTVETVEEAQELYWREALDYKLTRAKELLVGHPLRAELLDGLGRLLHERWVETYEEAA